MLYTLKITRTLHRYVVVVYMYYIMFEHFFKSRVDKLVDARLNEHLTAKISASPFHFVEVDDKNVEKLVSDFIVEQKEKNNKELSVYDFVVNLRLPAKQVSSILENFESRELIREI